MSAANRTVANARIPILEGVAWLPRDARPPVADVHLYWTQVPMKASRLEKLEVQLAEAEGTLLRMLTDTLPHTVLHGDALFFNSQFCPSYFSPHELDERGETLLSLSSESVSLRERIGLPLSGSIGNLFLSACEESTDVANHDRRGPRQLAAWLLDELKTTTIHAR